MSPEESNKIEQEIGQEWVISFGVKYGHEPHPSGFEWIDPNGYFVIEGVDEGQARALAHTLFDGAWAFIYEGGEFFRRETMRLTPLYPKGEIARLRLTVSE